MNILVIDIGNSSTKLGIYRSGNISSILNMPTNKINIPAFQKKFCSIKINMVAIASVVPSINNKWKSFLNEQNYNNLLWIDYSVNLGIGIDYPRPSQIGADRLANSAAAGNWLNLPAVICDFGTALTFDIITKEKGYIGGVICPGVSLMLSYLSEKTDLLPNISSYNCSENIGKTTLKAMQIGAKNGYQGMIHEVLKGIKNDLKIRRINVYATGGYYKQIVNSNLINMKYLKNLTLLGIGYIAELNKS